MNMPTAKAASVALVVVGLALLEEAVLQHDADGGAGQRDEPGRRRHRDERQ